MDATSAPDPPHSSLIDGVSPSIRGAERRHWGKTPVDPTSVPAAVDSLRSAPTIAPQTSNFAEWCKGAGLRLICADPRCRSGTLVGLTPGPTSSRSRFDLGSMLGRLMTDRGATFGRSGVDLGSTRNIALSGAVRCRKALRPIHALRCSVNLWHERWAVAAPESQEARARGPRSALPGATRRSAVHGSRCVGMSAAASRMRTPRPGDWPLRQHSRSSRRSRSRGQTLFLCLRVHG